MEIGGIEVKSGRSSVRMRFEHFHASFSSGSQPLRRRRFSCRSGFTLAFDVEAVRIRASAAAARCGGWIRRPAGGPAARVPRRRCRCRERRDRPSGTARQPFRGSAPLPAQQRQPVKGDEVSVATAATGRRITMRKKRLRRMTGRAEVALDRTGGKPMIGGPFRHGFVLGVRRRLGKN
jgi:hypothetical protein